MNIIGITPLERPDTGLALALLKAKAFPVIHLGYDKEAAAEALSVMARECGENFGVCLGSEELLDMHLPEQVSLAVLSFSTGPAGLSVSRNRERRKNLRTYYQVYSVEDARKAKAANADGIIIKGNEGAGPVGDETSFVLFQRIVKELPDTDLWVQGGIGVHTAAAFSAMGAKGVVLDSQLILYPECNAPGTVKEVCGKLTGNETKVIDHYRVLVRPDSPALPGRAKRSDLIGLGYLPLGQDVAVSADLVRRYKNLPALVFAIRESMYGHLNQAKTLDVISPGNALAGELNITYPVAQGPMTRVSDVPEFAEAVAEAGGLPFVALSLMKGEKARQLIRNTKELLKDKTWGIGILGFAPQELREEQIAYIKEEKPPVVLIAGGRPSQAKPLEKMGIKTFLHVPSVSLLDMFLKEGARRFVFEGRECGGHVGPLAGTVLWERQIERILQEDDAGSFNVLFAGGINDSLSAAFISVMAAPLAARGVKVGVLMGTAYIFTKEAVETGAILQKFQDQAIGQAETVLLETAPGHETRCLVSPFTRFFDTEKKRLQAKGTDRKTMWEQLEKLNVGRLRIAAKGIERKGEELISVNAGEQDETGMYMIGQAAALRDRTVSILDLHKEVASASSAHIQKAVPAPSPEAVDKAAGVAIVGMACIYPGAKNIEEYWRNILLGKDSVTEIPDERWNKELYFDPDSTSGDKTPSKWGGFIPHIDFDPVEFGIPPQSLSAIDPAQLLSLLVARQALEHAGYAGKEINRENVSVIIGTEGGTDLATNYGFRSLFRQIFGEIPEDVDKALPRLTEDSFPGVLANVTSGRITNRLDFGGRNYTVDAACASSLTAIDLACQELVLEKSEMVIAGAADLHNGIHDYLMFSSTHALSRKGKCMTFDAGADGIALGEGVAMVVLKRYDDAKRDGDKIYAVIRGVGGSSDGKSLGLTAPRKNGQLKSLERAYQQAGISPAVCGLIEAHGTGTVVGDRTELSALTELFIRSGAVPGQTHLGSVKSQIGHTKCAAGLAGLIKAALSVYHGVKPPSLHLSAPNAYYNRKSSPFTFNTQAGLWNEPSRRAGISAFGFGGTNFHTVIENDPGIDSAGAEIPDEPVLRSWPSELFVFRGDSYEEALHLLKAVKVLTGANNSIDIRDIAYSLAVCNAKPVQLSIVAESIEDLILKVDLALSGIEAAGVYTTKKLEGKVAFLFPGQGSQRVNMARSLFVAFPSMRRLLKGRPHEQEVLFPSAAFDPETAAAQKEAIKDTRLAQPLLGAVDLAMASFLRDLGIEPDMLAGHSYGELPALCFAGAFEQEELLPLSEKRAQAILDAIEQDKGAMVAVNCPATELDKILSGEKEVYAVNHNSPKQWVLAGTTAAIRNLTGKLRKLKISFRELEVACAFHSPLLAGAKDLYAGAIRETAFKTPAIPVWSNTTASEYPGSPDAIKERLCEHLVKPVRFTEEIGKMYAQGARVFIEVGPGKVLSGLAKAILGKDELVLHTEEPGREGITLLLSLLARYMSSGRTLKVAKLFEGRDAKQLDLDHPEQYRKKGTVWTVNGQMSLPPKGKSPAPGSMPVTTPLKLKGMAPAEQHGTESRGPARNDPGNPAEQMLLEYLNNMRQMVQAQRDVMLGYLGQAVQQTGPGSPGYSGESPHAGGGPVQPVRPLPGNGVSSHTRANGTVREPDPAVYREAAAPRRERPAFSEEDIKAVLMDIVSEKTGYPPEMLGMEMDLEADLSIDSIKRLEIIGELRIKLGEAGLEADPEEMAEQLAGIKTLKGLTGWIAAKLPGSRQEELVIPPAGSSPPREPAKIASETLSEQELRSVLLATISEKTGYPPEMLGMEMDLEADLSIDSIKRLEIVGELKGKIPVLNQAGDQSDELAEQLAAVKTLNGFVSWITEQASGSPEPAPEVPEVNGKNGAHLSRLRFQLTPSKPWDASPATLNGMRFAVTDDGSAIPACIKELLEKQGASADLVSAKHSLAAYNGLIILDIFSSPGRMNIIESFAMVKKLDPGKVKWVYAVSDFDGYTDQDADLKLLQHFQGYPGFLISLDQEWEHAKCRTVNLGAKLLPEKIAGITLNEILNPDTPSEVIYQNDIRQTRVPVPAQLAIGQTPDIHLNKQSTVLVFGGAQGITSELIIRFSKEYPCHYILVGRSPEPGKDAHSFTFLKDKDEIRKYLVGQGSIKTPAGIEKRTREIYKSNQIMHTIASLEAHGATAAYHSLDIRDTTALQAFLRQTNAARGGIDGVIHGAGLLEDKLLHHKTPESFERVFSTKVAPLRTLAEHLNAKTRFVILFSSVASVLGNRGQTDYAAANSVLDQYARVLKKRLKAKVIAINWGPWKGTGMISPALEKDLQRRGMSCISLQDGMETFVNELKYGNESQVLIMAQ